MSGKLKGPPYQSAGCQDPDPAVTMLRPTYRGERSNQVDRAEVADGLVI